MNFGYFTSQPPFDLFDNYILNQYIDKLNEYFSTKIYIFLSFSIYILVIYTFIYATLPIQFSGLEAEQN